MELTNGGPAFPTTKPLESWGDPNAGMTLRDYFAAKALPALIADGAALESIKRGAKACRQDGMDVTAQVAYAYADAMLRGRQ